jgi:aspartate kinase
MEVLIMNNLKVAKFGGSSLADALQFKKVKEIVLSDRDIRFVVPSAPGKRHSKDYKITDLLYLCHAHVKNSIPFEDVFRLIEERYKTLCTDLDMDSYLDPQLENLYDEICNGASEEYIASRGEYLNGLILAEYLGFEFVDAADIITFKKSGILDEQHTYEAIEKVLSNSEKAVIPGFYGKNSDGKIKTFSRGGSDVTGAIIARAVNAAVYENWTDVSGFLMADPRIVENPKQIEEISYKELRELSYMGANIFHEEAVFPVKSVGIPINIRNTNSPLDKGTMIVKDKTNINSGNITGISGKKDFTVISIEKTLMNRDKGYCRKVLSILEQNNVAFENIPAGIDSLSLVIDDKELADKLEGIIEEIQGQCRPDSLIVYPNMALIAVVGSGMIRTKGISARIFKALADNKINIRMINQGSSELSIIIGVENEDIGKSIKSVYDAFVS